MLEFISFSYFFMPTVNKDLNKQIKYYLRKNSPCCSVYFGQVFIFCMLINKNLLEWFLPIICNEHTLRRSRSLFSRNHPICFWLGRDSRQITNTEQLIYLADNSSHPRCSIKWAVLKNFAIFTGKQLCWSLFFIKL